MAEKLNHFDQHGNAVMVDVTDKNVTEREAIATGKIFVCDETYEKMEIWQKEMSLQLLEWLELWRLKKHKN